MSDQKYDKINHWYGWNGGECPVHPDTEVQVMLADGSMISRVASMLKWNYLDMPSTIVVFQIVKPYVPKVKREVALYRRPERYSEDPPEVEPGDPKRLFLVSDDMPMHPEWVIASESKTIEFTLLPGESAE